MNAEEFVRNFKRHKTELLAQYSDEKSDSAVAKRVAELGKGGYRAEVLEILDEAMTETIYGILLGLDGASSLGQSQQGYTIRGEDGGLVTSADDGELEGLAYEAFFGEFGDA